MSAETAWELLRARQPGLDWGRLESYAREVERWNRAIRLVGPKDLPGIRLQIVDALLPFLVVSPRFPLLDIGSGAGLPGIPIAIAFPEAAVVCLEPLAKRVSFLNQVVRQLGLGSVRVVGAKAEEAIARHPELAGSFAVVTARAVASPEVLLALASPFLAAGGRVLLPRGDEAIPQVPAWHLTLAQRYQEPVGVGARLVLTYERALGEARGDR